MKPLPWLEWLDALLQRESGRLLDRMASFAASRPAYEREIARARRYEHPLSVLVFRTGPRHVLPWVTAAERTSDGTLLRAALRQDDLVAIDPHRGQWIVLLPEADAQAAQGAMRRLHAFLATTLTGPFWWGAATFPDDGLLLDDLIATASGERESAPALRPRFAFPRAQNANGSHQAAEAPQ
jgi:hypothetical protein